VFDFWFSQIAPKMVLKKRFFFHFCGLEQERVIQSGSLHRIRGANLDCTEVGRVASISNYGAFKVIGMLIP
jgi:hypothetical protein